MRKHILILLFSMSLFSQEKVVVDLSSPYATIYTHLYYLQLDSYEPTKAAKVIYNKKEKEAEKLAIKLKQILDGKGLKVDINRIPRNTNYIDTLNIYGKKAQYALFPELLPEVYVEKINKSWYYSRETIEKIETLYKSVYPPEAEYLKNLIPNIGHKKILGIELWQYVGVILLLILATLGYFILNKSVFFLLKRVENAVVKLAHEHLNDVLYKLSRPIALLIVFYLVEHYVAVLQFSLGVNSFVIKGLEVGQIVLWIYVFLQFISVLISFYAIYSAKTESKLDDQLVPILNRLLRTIVVIFGILKMLTVFGVDTTTVIAGASIGGLAIALASQDTVRNLIGTFMIFLDKPFQIGDWIVGGGVEGTVEEVGFRSSRIRAADTSIFSIPNSKLSEIVINNMGLRKYRRYKTVLGLRYDTPVELIEAFVLGIRKLIELHPETRSDSYNVEFTGFGSSALEILINTYFLSLEWGVEQSSKHRLHIAIVKLAKDLGVDFAFPSQTVMIEQFPEKQKASMKYDISKDKINNVLEKISFQKEA